MQTSQSPNVTKMAVCYEMKMAMALAMAMECNADNWACAESGGAAMCSLDYDWITQAHCGPKCSDIVCVWGRRATPLFDKSYGFRATSLAYCVCRPPLCRAKSYRLWWRQTYLSAVESGRRLSWQISTPHLTTLPCLPDIFRKMRMEHCASFRALCWLNLCLLPIATLPTVPILYFSCRPNLSRVFFRVQICQETFSGANLQKCAWTQWKWSWRFNWISFCLSSQFIISTIWYNNNVITIYHRYKKVITISTLNLTINSWDLK